MSEELSWRELWGSWRPRTLLGLSSDRMHLMVPWRAACEEPRVGLSGSTWPGHGLAWPGRGLQHYVFLRVMYFITSEFFRIE